eukprot:764931-Hanusia_phi.AAC.4
MMLKSFPPPGEERSQQQEKGSDYLEEEKAEREVGGYPGTANHEPGNSSSKYSMMHAFSRSKFDGHLLAALQDAVVGVDGYKAQRVFTDAMKNIHEGMSIDDVEEQNMDAEEQVTVVKESSSVDV